MEVLLSEDNYSLNGMEASMDYKGVSVRRTVLGCAAAVTIFRRKTAQLGQANPSRLAPGS